MGHREQQQASFDDRFQVCYKLGEGGNSVVLAAYDKSQQRAVAIKIGNVDASDGADAAGLERESRIMRLLSSNAGQHGKVAPEVYATGVIKAAIPGSSGADDLENRHTTYHSARSTLAASSMAKQSASPAWTVTAAWPELLGMSRAVSQEFQSPQAAAQLVLQHQQGRIATAAADEHAITLSSGAAHTPGKGAPRQESRQFVAMELLGSALHKLFCSNAVVPGSLSERCCAPWGQRHGRLFFHCCREMLRCLQALHAQEYVHGDVKTDQFCLAKWEPSSVPGAPPELQVALVDYGTATRACDIPADDSYENFSGTLPFASVDMLRLRPPTFGDDLEGLALSFLDMYCGGLPWEHLRLQPHRLDHQRGPLEEQQPRHRREGGEASVATMGGALELDDAREQGPLDSAGAEDAMRLEWERYRKSMETYSQKREACWRKACAEGIVPDFIQRLRSMAQIHKEAERVKRRQAPAQALKPPTRVHRLFATVLCDAEGSQQRSERVQSPRKRKASDQGADTRTPAKVFRLEE